MFFISKLNRYRLHFIFFVFICKLSCSIDEENARNIIFEVLTKSKVIERLDLSRNVWKQFGVQNKTFKNQFVFMKQEILKAQIF